MWSIYTLQNQLLLWHYKAIEITTNEITDDKAWIEHYNLQKMLTGI